MTKIQSHCVCVNENNTKWTKNNSLKKTEHEVWTHLICIFTAIAEEESKRNRNFADELINFRNFCLMTCVQLVFSPRQNTTAQLHTNTIRASMTMRFYSFQFFFTYCMLYVTNIEIFVTSPVCNLFGRLERERAKKNCMCKNLCSRCVPYFMLEKTKRFTYTLHIICSVCMK